jgi:hypothetical protein
LGFFAAQRLAQFVQGSLDLIGKSVSTSFIET